MAQNKEELLKLVDELENEYDAYFFTNKYGDLDNKENTHAKHFKELKQLNGEKVISALMWIRYCYDCYYKNELDENSPFNYLREVIKNGI